eukprot:scaffold23726_cov48-Phaeocystis_antarctica.AAC.2
MYETLLLAEEQRTTAEGREARSDTLLAETNSQARRPADRRPRPQPRPPPHPAPSPSKHPTLHHPPALAGEAAAAAAGRGELAAAHGARGARHRHARDRAPRRPQ